MSEPSREAIKRHLQSFVDEMRAEGIHVGIGDPTDRCLTCGEVWPCTSSVSPHDDGAA